VEKNHQNYFIFSSKKPPKNILFLAEKTTKNYFIFSGKTHQKLR
jgi:hypothetical protein